MKNLKKTFRTSFIFGTSILIGSGVGYSLISQQAQSYNDVNTQTAYEQDQTEIADDFVNDLNSLQTGETYTLTNNVDLSYLTDPNANVQLASGVTIEGNGYTVSNRTFNDQTIFDLTSIANLENTYFFSTEITDSTITNLTFENFYFPIYGLNNSDLNNVNYINTNYSNLTLNLNSYIHYTDQGTVYNYYYEDIGLFINHMVNGSSFTNSTIENITFSNNTLDNQFEILIDTNFSMITVAPIARVIQPKTTEPTLNSISNIYVNDISYEGNSIVGYEMAPGVSNLDNYGDAPSIYFSPLLTATQGHKDSDAWLQIDMNHIVFNDITFGGDNDASEVSAYYSNTDITSGIYFSFYPSSPINTIAFYEDIFIFNSNIEGPDETNSTVYYTGYVNTLNNYTISTRVQVVAHNVFTYQQEQLSDYLILGSDFLQSSSSLENMLNIISFYDSENGETNPSITSDGQITKSYFDSKYWTIDEQSLNDTHLSLISKPSATNLSFEDEGNNVKVNFSFRAGVASDTINSWNLSLVDQNNVSYWNTTMSSGESVSFEISKETLFDPNNSFELQITSEDGSYASNTQEFNSKYFLPKFENTSNLFNPTTQQIDLTFSVDDPYELLTNSSISLYEDEGENDKLIESKFIIPYSNMNMSTAQTKEVQTYTISTTTTFDIGTQDPKEYFSNYFFDLDINYLFNGRSYSIDNYYLNIDQENSDVRFSTNNEPTQAYWYWILIAIIFLILIIVAILITWFWFRRRNQNLDLAIRFEEVTGLQIFE